MRTRMNCLFSFAALALIGLVFSGCQSTPHTMVDLKLGQVVVCSKCFDQIPKARGRGGPTGGLATNRMITTHLRED